MNWWVIADTHLGHDKMKEYCGRPEGFEEKILKQVAYHTREDDVLIHLGDVCIYKDEYWNRALTTVSYGKSWLIKGNHDKKSNSWYLDKGWDFVADTITLKMFGLDILLSHKPMSTSYVDVNVHGHHHNSPHHPEDAVDDSNILVHIEDNFRPVMLRKVVGM